MGVVEENRRYRAYIGGEEEKKLNEKEHFAMKAKKF